MSQEAGKPADLAHEAKLAARRQKHALKVWRQPPMAKTSAVVLRARPAPLVTSGVIRTCREVGESQGGARGGLTRRRFDWQGAPSPAPPGQGRSNSRASRMRMGAGAAIRDQHRAPRAASCTRMYL